MRTNIETDQQIIPAEGFMRISQIIGNPLAKPAIPGIFPVSATAWWEGIKKGIYPKGVKLSTRTTAWRVSDIRKLIAKFDEASQETNHAPK